MQSRGPISRDRFGRSYEWPKRSFVVLLSLGWLTLPSAMIAWGQEPAPVESVTVAQEGEDGDDQEEAKSFLEKVTIHGHLSQAYAFSDGNQIIGIPEDGTADYRTAALQIRADISEDDIFVVQLSHERLGLSRAQAHHEDVELDWIFYERKFGNSAVKVGRIPIPFGVYNEVRDVGTVLPFYRPSRPLYEEGAFTAESVDGVLLAHGFSLGAWHLEADAHFGNWEYFDAQLNPVKVDNSLGLELWLETPVSGLKLGIGGLRMEVEGTTTPRQYRQLSHFSIAGDFGRVTGEIELKRDTFQRVSGGRGAQANGGYARLGVGLTPKLILQGEYDFLHVQIQTPKTDKAKDNDRALGLNYRFRPDLVLKAEYHWVNGFRVEGQPGLIPGRPVPDYKTQFGILSLATSF
jgi:hypothetical protein